MDVFLLCVVTTFFTWIGFKLHVIIRNQQQLREKCLQFPGPRPHFLLGNLDQIKTSTDYQNVVYDLTRKGAKTYCIWTGPFPNIGTTHPDTAKDILRSSTPKAHRICDGYRMLLPWLGNGLLLSSGRLWERSRRLLTPAFHFEILKDYFPTYNVVADILLDNLSKATVLGASVEVYDYVSKATLDTMLRCTLSYVDDVQRTGDMIHPYVDAVRKLSHMLWRRMLILPYIFDFIYFRTSEGKEFLRHADYCHKLSEKLIAARKQALEKGCESSHKKHLDFLDILLRARTEDGESLDDLAIRNEVDTFLFEGHDTTASAISFVIYSLAQHEEDQEIVYNEVSAVVGNSDEIKWSHLPNLKKLTCFVKESMRFYSPVPNIARLVDHDVELDGKIVPAGVRVDINLQAIHHNPDVWEDPMTFDMSRFEEGENKDPYAYVPFSAGPRFKVLDDPAHKVVILPEVVTRAADGIKVFLKPRQ